MIFAYMQLTKTLAGRQEIISNRVLAPVKGDGEKKKKREKKKGLVHCVLNVCAGLGLGVVAY